MVPSPSTATMASGTLSRKLLDSRTSATALAESTGGPVPGSENVRTIYQQFANLRWSSIYVGNGLPVKAGADRLNVGTKICDPGAPLRGFFSPYSDCCDPSHKFL